MTLVRESTVVFRALWPSGIGGLAPPGDRHKKEHDEECFQQISISLLIRPHRDGGFGVGVGVAAGVAGGFL
jgi:hypothetical protein